MSIIKMTDLDLAGKYVLIREDFNVPVNHGQITSDARVKAALFTIETALRQNARVMLISHLGRPKEGQYDEQFSLRPIANALSQLLKTQVRFVEDWMHGITVEPGEVVLCENVRFLTGEKTNDPQLARKIAHLCDIFVMDAFGSAHRKQVSTYGIAQYAPIACAGPLLIAELEALKRALNKPERPLTTIVGGSKVSTKLGVLASVIKLSNYLIVGGGIANTFLAACGYDVGRSLCEHDLLAQARELINLAKQQGTKLFLPTDVIVAKELSETAKPIIKTVDALDADDQIFDFGPQSQHQLAEIIQSSKTIIWNGPIGIFEYPPFEEATKKLAMAIAESQAFSIAGGGDTLAAIEKYDINDQISYISTGGGAFLEFLEQHQLPAVEILERHYSTEHHHQTNEG